MALIGTAFLAIWHDIKPEGEAEYNRWHTQEHMPERVGVPGFERARRYADWKLTKYRYYTLYDGTTLDVFQSAPYRERLNNPTPWSNRMQPNFLNFARSACLTLASVGAGVGGAIATIRLNFADGDVATLRSGSGKIADAIMQLHGICGVHIGKAEPSVTRVHTRETELRRLTGEDVFDAVIMVEGIGRGEVEAAMPAVQKILKDAGLKIASSEAAIYDLAYSLLPGEAE
jgi:hypothetical protein